MDCEEAVHFDYCETKRGITLREMIYNESSVAQFSIELKDNEWQYTYIDHDRVIVRAIVFDDNGKLYFVRVIRDDDFGKAELIETSGGGVEKGEALTAALERELKEELGVRTEILCKLGVVNDCYNMIHRHNINNYYLCRALSFGERRLTAEEAECFHLSVLKLSYDEAVREYEKCSGTRIGRLIANRELPVLKRAGELLKEFKIVL